jgi:asparagine synthase (glutamine-hydrolysing)
VVADQISGQGLHSARLHWLGGDFPHRYDRRRGELTLATPCGPFCIAVLGPQGEPLSGDVASGVEDPPRGWLSRHYGEKIAVPSLAVEAHGVVPLRFVTVLSFGPARIEVAGKNWSVEAGGLAVRFELEQCAFRRIDVHPAKRVRKAFA